MLQDSHAQAQPDELIDFHHLKARRGMSQLEIEDQVQTDLQRATGLAETGSEDASRLNRVLQLTGEPCLLRCLLHPMVLLLMIRQLRLAAAEASSRLHQTWMRHSMLITMINLIVCVTYDKH